MNSCLWKLNVQIAGKYSCQIFDDLAALYPAIATLKKRTSQVSLKSIKGPNQPISEMAVHGNVWRFIKKTRNEIENWVLFKSRKWVRAQCLTFCVSSGWVVSVRWGDHDIYKK